MLRTTNLITTLLCTGLLQLSICAAYAQLGTEEGAKQISVSLSNTAPSASCQETVAPPIGDFVLFTSASTNISDLFNSDFSSATSNIYLRRRDEGTQLISTNTIGRAPNKIDGQNLPFGCHSPAISKVAGNGAFAVAFTCDAQDLVTGYIPPNNNKPRQVYVKFFNSVSSPGATILASGRFNNALVRGGNSVSDQPTIALVNESPLDYRVCFRTRASDLLSGVDTPLTFSEVYCELVRQSDASIVTGSRISVKTNLTEPDGLNEPALSADGSILVFSSTGTMLTGLPGNGSRQIYSYKFTTGEMLLVSYTASGALSGGNATRPSISKDGSAIAFQYQPASTGSDLKGIEGGIRSTFVVREGAHNAAFRRVNTNASGVQSDGNSFGGTLHANGRFATFLDRGNNLVSMNDGSPASIRHAYIKDLATGEIARTDVKLTTSGSLSSGTDDAGVNVASHLNVPLAIGRDSADDSSYFVAFNSVAVNLATAGAPSSSRPFVYASSFNTIPDTPTPTATPTITPTSTITPTATSTPTVTPTATLDPVTAPPVLLENNVRISDPPVISVSTQNPDGTSDVTISFRRFRVDRRLFSRSKLLRVLGTSKPSLTYHLDLRKDGSKFRIRRVLSRNSTTIRKLRPGTYNVRYRVVATKGNKKVQSRLSPPANFTVT